MSLALAAPLSAARVILAVLVAVMLVASVVLAALIVEHRSLTKFERALVTMQLVMAVCISALLGYDVLLCGR